MARIDTPRRVRGTQDILGDEQRRFARVIEAFEQVRRLYCFQQVQVPVFESTAVFARSMGEFGATLMVAGSIPGKTQTLSIAVYEAVQAGQDDSANLMVIITSLVCITVLIAANKLTPNRNPQG